MMPMWAGKVHSVVQTDNARVHRVGFKATEAVYEEFQIELPHDHGLTVGNEVLISIEEVNK